MDADAALREWERDAARADSELEGGAAVREPGQKLHGGIDDGGVELVPGRAS